MRKLHFIYLLSFVLTGTVIGQKQDSIQGVVIQNENQINTGSLEFSPSFHEDGIVYIVSQDLGKAKKATDTRLKKYTMSIYEAKRGADGKLGQPTPFSKELTSKYHEGPLTFDKSGEKVYFTRNNNIKGKAIKSKDGFTHLRIYSADRVGNEWKNIQDLSINSDDFDCVHPSISIDGTKIYFASDRPGGSGGMDIWMSVKNGDSWGEPVNLGTNINSGGNDVFPYIHPDGTLYYASDGKGGAGGYDMFYSSETGDTWEKALPMPFPFNTSFDDFGLIVDLEGKNGYFTSNRAGGEGEDDIYSFNAIDNLSNLLNGKGGNLKRNQDFTVYVADFKSGESIEDASVSILNLDELSLSKVFSMVDESGKLIQVQTESAGSNDLVLSVDVDANGQTATTDNEGKHIFKVAKGSYIIKVKKQGYQTKQVQIPESANLKETLVLLEAGDNTVLFKGMVINEKLNAPMAGAKVQIQEEGSDKVENLIANKAGQFEYNMKKGKTYLVTTEKNGIKETKRITVPADAKDEPLVVAFNGTSNGGPGFGFGPDGSPLYDENGNYTGKGFVEGAVVRLPNIYYNFNDASIRPDAEKDLNGLISIMKQIPEIEIELSSHTDSRGSASYNKALSQRRATNAIQYLTKNSIKRNRLRGVGYGESKLKNGCSDGVVCTEYEHQLNRRTEFRITKLKTGLNVQYMNNTPEGDGMASASQKPAAQLNADDFRGANMLMVIAGTFADINNAEKRLNEVKSKGFSSAMIEPAENSSNNYVVVDKLKDADQAVSLANDLKSKGFKSFIKKK